MEFLIGIVFAFVLMEFFSDRIAQKVVKKLRGEGNGFVEIPNRRDR